MEISWTALPLAQVKQIPPVWTSLSEQVQVTYDSSLGAVGCLLGCLRHWLVNHHDPSALYDVLAKHRAFYALQAIPLVVCCEHLANRRVVFGGLLGNPVVVFYGLEATRRALFCDGLEEIHLFVFYDQEANPCLVFYHDLGIPRAVVCGVESPPAVFFVVEETA